MRNNWQLNYGKPFYQYALVALHGEDSLGSGYIGQQLFLKTLVYFLIY